MKKTNSYLYNYVVMKVILFSTNLQQISEKKSFITCCTMAAKKFRPSFFRHFKKIDVVHSLLSL
jgi:hypothetical protein